MTTNFTVDHYRDTGVTQDLAWFRSYMVAVRAVTTSPAQASPWLLSADAHPALAPDGGTMSVSRAAGSVSLSWNPPQHAQGYEIQCATRENNVTGTYTLCADVETATVTNSKISITISSWSTGGNDYTIDDTKTYDLKVKTTNVWGDSAYNFAPLIHPHMVSNLTSTKHATYKSPIDSGVSAAVAFTTGSNADSYVLKSVTMPLKNDGGTSGVTFHLQAMAGTEQYSSSSAASGTNLATLSPATPTASTWTDTTVTCSGSGCSLSPNTTYFVIASSVDASTAYSWSVSTSETKTAEPSSNGWSVGFGHFKPTERDSVWKSHGDWNIAEIVFATVTSLTASNVTSTSATLTIKGHTDDWYHKYTSPSGGTCSGPVTGTSATVTLIAGTSYTFAAYRDASCNNLLGTTTITGEKPAAPTSVTATSVAGEGNEKYLSSSWQKPLWATQYHVTYTCNNGGDWGLIAKGTVEAEGSLSQIGQTVTAKRDLAVENGWWHNQSPQCRMGVRAGNHNGWSVWVNSNLTGPPQD